jgi:hypothetical protein
MDELGRGYSIRMQTRVGFACTHAPGSIRRGHRSKKVQTRLPAPVDEVHQAGD